MGQGKVTIRVIDQDWGEVVSDVCSQASLHVVLPGRAEKDALRVTMLLFEVAAVDALRALGTVAGMVPRYRDGMVTFEPTTLGALGVVTSGYLSSADALEVVEAVVGTDGAVRSAGPHLVVAGNDDAVNRATRLGSVLEKSEPGQWLVSVWICEVSSEVMDRLGVELGVTGLLEGVLESGGASSVARAVLRGTMEASHHRRWAKVINHASVVLVEGSPSSIRNVSTVPVPERSVSPHGTVTVSGYSFVDAGMIVELDGRAVPGGALRLEVTPELSSINGFVEDAPIVARRSMKFAAMVGSGDWVVLAGLDQMRDQGQAKGLFELSSQKEYGTTSVVLILRAVRVEREGWRIESAGSAVAGH